MLVLTLLTVNQDQLLDLHQCVSPTNLVTQMFSENQSQILRKLTIISSLEE